MINKNNKNITGDYMVNKTGANLEIEIVRSSPV